MKQHTSQETALQKKENSYIQICTFICAKLYLKKTAFSETVSKKEKGTRGTKGFIRYLLLIFDFESQ